MCWSLLASKYVQEAVPNVMNQWNFAYPGLRCPKRAATPFLKDYHPELDVSKELGPTEDKYYQSLIGIVLWMIEFGRIDMITEVYLLSSFLSSP